MISDPMVFGRGWVQAWNDHDLEKILSHYSDDIEFISPNVARYFKDPTGTIRGIQTIRAYFRNGLNNNPDLHFDLKQVLAGVNSVTLHYHNGNNDKMAAEVMMFNEQGKVNRVHVHYAN